MNVQETLGPIVEQLQRSASVETVYGEPVETDSRTVIPVAKVAYGFGGGSGPAPDENEGEKEGEEKGEEKGGEEGDRSTGIGGGGGVSATPVGALEITETSTRFVRFSDPKRTLVWFVSGLLVGLLVGKRR